MLTKHRIPIEKEQGLTSNIHLCLRLLREFRKIDPEFPLQYAICLLHISLKEGLSLTELAEKTGLALSTISRIVGALSDSRQKGQAFHLIKVQVAVDERRRKALYLSPRGKAVIESVAELFEPAFENSSA